jgi:hypothetical protein
MCSPAAFFDTCVKCKDNLGEEKKKGERPGNRNEETHHQKGVLPMRQKKTIAVLIGKGRK